MSKTLGCHIAREVKVRLQKVFRFKFRESQVLSMDQKIGKRDICQIVLQQYIFLRIQFKLNTALLSYCPCVRVFVTGVTSHISHIYKGINAMLIIRGPIKPYIF